MEYIYQFECFSRCPRDEIYDMSMRQALGSICRIALGVTSGIYADGLMTIFTEEENEPTFLSSVATFVFNELYNKEYLMDLGNYNKDNIPEQVLKRDRARKLGILFRVTILSNFDKTQDSYWYKVERD